MPYLHWQSELKCDTSYSFESEKWNMPDLFLDYFQRRWITERKKLDQADKENLAYKDFCMPRHRPGKNAPASFAIR